MATQLPSVSATQCLKVSLGCWSAFNAELLLATPELLRVTQPNGELLNEG